MKSYALFIVLIISVGVSGLSAERSLLKARASELDPGAREYPEINFGFGSAEKPEDWQRASVDPVVTPRGELVIWLMGDNDEFFERLNGYGLHVIQPHYARAWIGSLCEPSPWDETARGDVRLEAATGDDFSSELNLVSPDGMMARSRRFLVWLAQEHPRGDVGAVSHGGINRRCGGTS